MAADDLSIRQQAAHFEMPDTGYLRMQDKQKIHRCPGTVFTFSSPHRFIKEPVFQKGKDSLPFQQVQQAKHSVIIVGCRPGRFICRIELLEAVSNPSSWKG